MNTKNWKELSIEDKAKVFAKDIATRTEAMNLILMKQEEQINARLRKKNIYNGNIKCYTIQFF